MREQIVDSWHINNRVNLILIDAIDDDGLNCTLSKRGGNTVALQFAHLHNIRLLKLERFDGSLAKGLSKLKRQGGIGRVELRENLKESAIAIGQMFEKAMNEGGRIKGFKRGVIPLLGYFISHESHHRGNILVTLKQCGHKIPRAIQYKIWSWNQI